MDRAHNVIYEPCARSRESKARPTPESGFLCASRLSARIKHFGFLRTGLWLADRARSFPESASACRPARHKESPNRRSSRPSQLGTKPLYAVRQNRGVRLGRYWLNSFRSMSVSHTHYSPTPTSSANAWLISLLDHSRLCTRRRAALTVSLNPGRLNPFLPLLLAKASNSA